MWSGLNPVMISFQPEEHSFHPGSSTHSTALRDLPGAFVPVSCVSLTRAKLLKRKWLSLSPLASVFFLYVGDPVDTSVVRQGEGQGEG